MQLLLQSCAHSLLRLCKTDDHLQSVATFCAGAGVTVGFSFTLNNIGNVNLRNMALLLSDARVQSALACTPTLPAAWPVSSVTTCTSTYTFTQDDMEVGNFVLSGNAIAADLTANATLTAITLAVPNTPELQLTLDNSTCAAPSPNFAGEPAPATTSTTVYLPVISCMHASLILHCTWFCILLHGIVIHFLARSTCVRLDHACRPCSAIACLCLFQTAWSTVSTALGIRSL